MAEVWVSVVEHFLLCEVRTFCRAITAITVSVSVFVCLCKNEGLHVLKLLPAIVTYSVNTRLDTRKDQ